MYIDIINIFRFQFRIFQCVQHHQLPEPCRGQRNNSALIPHIAARIGQVLGLSAQAVLRQTAENARALYGLQV